MKKFLSLVLALVMAMSLVTISAGATEYKDLTDKDEIQYEEAVAVLNRLGIITGYSDGSFRPTGELTRGAAAKIIVSLMIGPEAAGNLTVSSAPYSDVPVDNTFAAVINYCKSAGYISGYGDGTFRPNGKLTGYAFGKMLLGALGYKSSIEGFEGAGWNMKVAAIGNEAGLFDRVSFKGNEQITRDVACQLALNTLKGTLVEYNGGMNVTNGDQSVVVNPTRSYKTSNQEFAQHINNKKAGGQQLASDTWYTVEFGEEHFVDLRMQRERSVKDDFGRPSNEWSYKKVTIGTYPVEPDYVYTTRVAAIDDPKVTSATKTRALGLNGFETFDDAKRNFTTVTVNGLELDDPFSTTVNDVDKIADYTDNGTIVEVYVDDDDADFISDVVVIKTQLMEVKKLGSDYVTLSLYDDGSDYKKENAAIDGFNQAPIDEKVENVEVEDECYAFLSGLKVEDIVAVVPVTTDGAKTYTVADAYAPETVTGSLDGSETFAVATGDTRMVTEVTVGGTAYSVALWNKDLNNADRDIIKVTKKDVTLYLDLNGNALLAEDIGSTNDFMIIGCYRNAVENGVIVTLANGWDIKGNPVSLNIGAESSQVVANAKNTYRPGDLVRYTNEGTTGVADWVLESTGVFDVAGNDKADNTTYAIKKSNSTVALENYKVDGKAEVASAPVWKDNDIKTIYVSFDNGHEVDYIEVIDGLQDVSKAEIDYAHPFTAIISGRPAQACVKLSSGKVTEDSVVKAIVIKQESNNASLANLAFISNLSTSNKRDENNVLLTDYEVFTGQGDDTTMTASKGIGNHHFVRYAELENGNFDLRDYDRTHKTISVVQATVAQTLPSANNKLIKLDGNSYYSMNNKALTLPFNEYDEDDVRAQNGNDFRLPNITDRQNFGSLGYGWTDLTAGDALAANLVNLRNAQWKDLTRYNIDDADDLEDALKEGKTVKVAMAFNDNPESDDFRQVYMFIITEVTEGAGSNVPVDTKYSSTPVINGAYLDITRTNVWDAATTAAADAELNNWLVANGYRLVGAAAGTTPPASGGSATVIESPLSLLKDGEYVTLIPRITYQHTITVNGSVVKTLEYGTRMNALDYGFSDLAKLEDDDVTYFLFTGPRNGNGGTNTNNISTSTNTGNTYPFNSNTYLDQPVIITTGFVSVNGGAINLTAVGYTDKTVASPAATLDEVSGEFEAGKLIKVSGTTYAKAGDKITLTVSFDRVSSRVKDAKIDVNTTTIGGDTESKTLAASKIAGSDDDARKVTFTVTIPSKDVNANDIDVTVVDGSKTVTLSGNKPQVSGVDEQILPENLTEAGLGMLTGSDLTAAAEEIMKNINNLAPGAYGMTPTMIIGLNEGTGAGSPAGEGGANMKCVLFPYEVPAKGSTDYYVLIVTDSDGDVVGYDIRNIGSTSSFTSAKHSSFYFDQSNGGGLDNCSGLTAGDVYGFEIFYASSSPSFSSNADAKTAMTNGTLQSVGNSGTFEATYGNT